MQKVDIGPQSLVLCSHGYVLFHHNTVELAELTSIGGDISRVDSV